MDIKVLTSITSTPELIRDSIVIGTHNGVFHCDDVVAVATICLLGNDSDKIIIVRSRDPKELEKCWICVDVGGGKYDHHMPGFDLRRPNNTKYASAGLVWEKFGYQVVARILSKYCLFEKINKHCDELAKIIDDTIIKFIDSEDNGTYFGKHCMSSISDFLPVWFEKPDFEASFQSALNMAMVILEKKILQAISEIYARHFFKEILSNPENFSDHILEIPSQITPWVNEICQFNSSSPKTSIDFVIFPFPDGGWAAQCVPMYSKGELKFKSRIPFPKEWAGQTTELEKISGVAGATFCHNNLFFIRAKNKEDVIKMCKIAMNE